MTWSLQSPRMALLQQSHAALVRQGGSTRPATTPPPVFNLAPSAQAGPKATPPLLHRVRRGDTLSHIVRQHLKAKGGEPTNAELYAAVQAVVKANGLRDPNLIQPGQQLDLSALKKDEAAPVTPVALRQPMAAPARGEGRLERVLPPQELLRELRTSRLALERDRATEPPAAQGGPSGIQAAEENASRIAALVTRLRDSVSALSDEPWSPVLAGAGRLTSGYGMRCDPFTGQQRFHHGIDLAAPIGTPILAPLEGTVLFSGWRPGYGNLVEMRHADGSLTRYGHNSENLVRRGERVAAGTAIAKVGSTGRSTGPHVHFEVRREGRSVNPMPFIEAARVQLAADHSR